MFTSRQLEEATEYANYAIKEGYIDEEELENLTDEEYVAKVNEIRDKGDAYAESARKDE